MRNDQSGFSLAEITLSLGLFAILFSIGIFSISRSQQSSSLSSTTDTFLADFKEQQMKAMAGDTETSGGAAAENYGIHFEGSSYTLFRDTYSAGNANNFIVQLPSSVQATTQISIPGYDNEVVFNRGDGGVASYNPTANQITFKDTTMSTVIKTITINKYGAITNIVNQ